MNVKKFLLSASILLLLISTSYADSNPEEIISDSLAVLKEISATREGQVVRPELLQSRRSIIRDSDRRTESLAVNGSDQ